MVAVLSVERGIGTATVCHPYASIDTRPMSTPPLAIATASGTDARSG